HHENLFVSWDEITTPFKIKKHAGHPLNPFFLKFYINFLQELFSLPSCQRASSKNCPPVQKLAISCAGIAASIFVVFWR
ncbi:hypothetical protein, partial [uncultured Desulfovibrio sp.]|uniref:hypothetical protein n=1 Tax=uncultured Desulfovibrio sp. TaxID=167968 RepID=UPI0026282593